MKIYKITEEQIKHIWGVLEKEEVGYLQQTVSEWFPEVFETKLEVGKWIKDEYLDNWLAFWNEKGQRYGFNSEGNWFFEERPAGRLNLPCNRYATEEEVNESLIKEAKKRGYKEGLTIKSELGKFKLNKGKIFIDAEGDLVFGNYKDRYTLFSNGKWAEIIEEEIKVVENEEPSPRYTVTFETLGAVTVTLEGNNLDNLMAIAKDNNLR